MSRTRLRKSAAYPPGTFTTTGGVSSNGNSSVFRKEQITTDEQHGKGKENHFFSKEWTAEVEPLNGREIDVNTQAIRGQFAGYIPVRASVRLGPMLVPDNDRALATTVFSRSNPSRPYVDTGVFVGELRDLPGMFQGVWQSAFRIFQEARRRPENVLQALQFAFIGGAKDYFPNADRRFIENQFGWLPFVSDVQKYLNVADVVEKRYRELQHLRTYGRSSRRIRLDTGRTHTSSIVTLNSSTGRVYKAFETDVQNYERWGVGKWKLDVGGRLSAAASIEEITRLADASVKGLTLDQLTAWNLMPWSWLIDWAGNTGDWIQSSRNIVGATKASASIMTTSVALKNAKRDPAMDGQKFVEGGSFLQLLVQKRRTIHSPDFILPEMTIDILSNRQSAILGALMTSRLKRMSF